MYPCLMVQFPLKFMINGAISILTLSVVRSLNVSLGIPRMEGIHLNLFASHVTGFYCRNKALTAK